MNDAIDREHIRLSAGRAAGRYQNVEVVEIAMGSCPSKPCRYAWLGVGLAGRGRRLRAARAHPFKLTLIVGGCGGSPPTIPCIQPRLYVSFSFRGSLTYCPHCPHCPQCLVL